MAATDVIFRIGTMGITQAQAELGAVVAALYKIGKAVADQIKKADEFSDVWTRLSEDQKNQVNAMDTATKGFINTVATMTATAKLGAAQVDTNSKGMAAMALVAADTAKRLGEGPEGAARRLGELTNALIKGSDKGLKPYGIQLESTGTLAEKQAEAFRKLEERAKNLKVEIDGLDDKWDALLNTVEKQRGLMYSYSDSLPVVGEAIDYVRAQIELYNTAMVQTNGKVNDYIYTGQAFSDTISRHTIEIVDATGRFYGWATAVEWATAKLKEHNIEALKAMGFGTKPPPSKPKDKSFLIGETTTEGATGTTELGTWTADEGFVGEGLETWDPDYVAPAVGYYTAYKKKPKRGGKKKEDEMVFSEEEAFGYYMSDIGQGSESASTSVAETELILGNLDASKANIDGMFLGMQGITEEQQKYNEQLASQLELESNISGTDGVSSEDKQLAFDAEYEHGQRMIEIEWERQDYMARTIDLQHAFTQEVVQSSTKTHIANQLAISGWHGLMGATKAALGAAIDGSMSAGKAFKAFVADVLKSIAVEMAIQAVAEAVRGLIELAGGSKSKAAQHFAAAAAAGVAAGIAGAAASVLSRDGESDSRATVNSSNAFSGGSSGGGGGGSSYGGGGYEAQPEGPTEIVLYVDGSMANLFSQLNVEAVRQKKTGTYSGGK